LIIVNNAYDLNWEKNIVLLKIDSDNIWRQLFPQKNIFWDNYYERVGIFFSQQQRKHIKRFCIGGLRKLAYSEKNKIRSNSSSLIYGKY